MWALCEGFFFGGGIGFFVWPESGPQTSPSCSHMLLVNEGSAHIFFCTWSPQKDFRLATVTQHLFCVWTQIISIRCWFTFIFFSTCSSSHSLFQIGFLVQEAVVFSKVVTQSPLKRIPAHPRSSNPPPQPSEGSPVPPPKPIPQTFLGRGLTHAWVHRFGIPGT